MAYSAVLIQLACRGELLALGVAPNREAAHEQVAQFLNSPQRVLKEAPPTPGLVIFLAEVGELTAPVPRRPETVARVVPLSTLGPAGELQYAWQLAKPAATPADDTVVYL